MLEDLGRGPCLADLLQALDPDRAVSGLLEFAAALGQLHAATTASGTAFRQLRAGLNPGTPSPAFRPDETWLRHAVPRVCRALAAVECRPAPGFEAEIRHVARAMAEEGLFTAFSPGDPCPDNHRWGASALRFFDFEFCEIRNGFLDAAYLRLPFPTCWCVHAFPAGLSRRLEAAYRREWVRGGGAAAEDGVFRQAMAEACVWWVVETLGWSLEATLGQDETWGTCSQRQRHLHQLETLCGMLQEAGHLPALAATVGALTRRLQDLWPDTSLPLYPAFR